MSARLLPPSDESIRGAAAILRAGGLVAFPTETVYGLGADGFSAKAVGRIFEVKGRPADNPLILHVAEAGEISGIAGVVPREAWKLAERFWPGALTLVLRRAEKVPAIVSAGRDTIAVRVPDHPVALALLRATERPLAAPSANKSGRPSPTSAKHVMDEIGDRIEAVIDGGDCRIGIESTVLDCTTERFQILRPGGVSADALSEVLGYLPGLASEEQGASPGTRHEHYRPSCAIHLFTGFPPEVRRGEGIVTLTQPAPKAEFSVRVASPEDYARRLYDLFREADALGLERLHMERPPYHDLGVALNDRLLRAAGRSR